MYVSTFSWFSKNVGIFTFHNFLYKLSFRIILSNLTNIQITCVFFVVVSVLIIITVKIFFLLGQNMGSFHWFLSAVWPNVGKSHPCVLCRHTDWERLKAKGKCNGGAYKHQRCFEVLMGSCVHIMINLLLICKIY